MWPGGPKIMSAQIHSVFVFFFFFFYLIRFFPCGPGSAGDDDANDGRPGRLHNNGTLFTKDDSCSFVKIKRVIMYVVCVYTIKGVYYIACTPKLDLI